MRIHVKHTHAHDWRPLPKGAAEPTEAEQKSRNFKLSAHGTWLMKVPVESPHSDMNVGEDEIAEQMVLSAIKQKRVISRTQAAINALDHLVIPNLFDTEHVSSFEVHDDRVPCSDLAVPHGDRDYVFTKFDAHVAASNIPADMAEKMKAAYVKDVPNDHHEKHLHRHFDIKVPE